MRALQLAPDCDGVRTVAEATLMPGDVSEWGRPCPVFRARSTFDVNFVTPRNCMVRWRGSGSTQLSLGPDRSLKSTK